VPEQATGEPPSAGTPPVPLTTIIREWGRIGCIGFGGPPAHIALLRRLCVEDRQWLPPGDFEDGLAACNLLPGPASTQLAIFCAWRLRGPAGAVLGGICFIVPGLVIILGLAALFLAPRPPGWISGATAGAGAAVPAVAVAAASGLIPASWRRAGNSRAGNSGAGNSGAGNSRAGGFRAGGSGGGASGAPADPPAGEAPPGNRAAHGRWVGYLVAGGVAAATVGPWLVLVLAACGLIEVAVRTPRGRGPRGVPGPSGLPAAMLPLAAAVPAAAGLLAVAWEGFKVGALSYGGGFVIIPLMQHDAVHTYHWMTAGQFLSAVALGQVTPGPVVQTVAVVGYAAAGLGGGLLAALVAFAPSFLFVLGGGRYFDRLRSSAAVQAFLTGAGPAAIGAIAGAAIPLALGLMHLWQVGVLALAAAWLLGVRRGVVSAIVGAAGLGLLAFAAGAPVG
jgi:chromate transporter